LDPVKKKDQCRLILIWNTTKKKEDEEGGGFYPSPDFLQSRRTMRGTENHARGQDGPAKKREGRGRARDGKSETGTP